MTANIVIENMFRNYFERLAKSICGFRKFLGVPLNQALKTPSSYNHDVDKWMTKNPGGDVTVYEVCCLFNAAYLRSASQQTSVGGFGSAGIWPFIPDVLWWCV